jgi:alginate O-acetyltransferase complex protein AlgI
MIDFNAIGKLFAYDAGSPVMFQTGPFLLLFALFYLIYALVYQSIALRKILVLGFSIYFYVMASGEYVGILIATILIDFLVALQIQKASSRKAKGWYLGLSIIGNVVLLGYFKYTNFLIDIGNFLSAAEIPHHNIFLPIGISFFTFQTISYKVDVYKEKLEASRSLIDYAFYITFFPHLVAGPIVRAKDFLYQINGPLFTDKLFISEGLYLIIKGFIKKAIVADYVAQYVDLVYANPKGFSGLEHIMAMYAYTLQIFCDFSGYTDMAIGLAAIMGFKLCENFRSPYRAWNITDFWRRWHMSLSSWLRDYVYIPLGGNRDGLFKQQVNQLLTMLIGGLWHGASWRFIVWGGAHGLALVGHKLWRLSPLSARTPDNKFTRFIGWFITFHIVAFLWMLFRINNIETLSVSINQMLYDSNYSAYILPFWQARPLVVVMVVLGFAFTLAPDFIKNPIKDHIVSAPLVYKAIIFIVAIHISLELSGQGVQPFIYFQF